MGVDRIDWRQDGICGKPQEQQRLVGYWLDSDEFFQVDMSTKQGRSHVDRCKTVCRACPVLAECREYALFFDPDPRWAVIGGLAPNDIARARKGAA